MLGRQQRRASTPARTPRLSRLRAQPAPGCDRLSPKPQQASASPALSPVRGLTVAQLSGRERDGRHRVDSAPAWTVGDRPASAASDSDPTALTSSHRAVCDWVRFQDRTVWLRLGFTGRVPAATTVWLYRSEMRFGLRCLRVFVDQPVEDLAPADSHSVQIDNSWPGFRGVGWVLVAALVGGGARCSARRTRPGRPAGAAGCRSASGPDIRGARYAPTVPRRRSLGALAAGCGGPRCLRRRRPRRTRRCTWRPGP
jgi:hypothetical protein